MFEPLSTGVYKYLMQLDWGIQKLILETRFADGYLYWDKTGHAARRLLAHNPAFEVSTATPSELILQDDKAQITVALSPQHSNVNIDRHERSKKDTLADFTSICGLVADIVFNDFQIKNVTRLGNRMTFAVKVASVEQSKAQILQVAEKSKLTGGFLSRAKDERLRNRKLKEITHRYEDDKLGMTLTLKTVRTQYNIKGPYSQEAAAVLPAAQVLTILDIDVYTVGLLPTDRVLTDEFIQTNIRMVETQIFPLVEV